MNKTKKVLLAVVACSALFAGALALTACNSKSEHAHNWSEWTVTDANKPSGSATGKATRYCTAAGCTANAGDKEYILPVLTSEDYTLSDNTATCVNGGTATYAYSKNEVTVSFTAASKAKGHTYGEAYTCEDETQHSQTCIIVGCGYINKQNHITVTKQDNTYHWDGCEYCDYEGEKSEHTINKRKYDEDNHWTGCSYEGCTARDEDTVETHSYETIEIIKYATASEQGEKQIECECGYKKTVKFDGVVSTCDLTSLYTAEVNRFGVETSRTVLTFIEGKYYHLRDSKPIYLNLSSTVATVDFYYSTDGESYTAIPTYDLNKVYPVAYLFDGENDRYSVVITTDEEVKIKADIFVTDESIAVTKQFTIAPVPELEKPQAEIYSETTFAYEWADIADTAIYLGQQLNIKALGYTVTVSGQTVTLNEQGEGTFTPTAAGKYTVTITSLYNAKDSYTATLTVKEEVDTSALLSGSYAGGDYTVAFGDNNSITVSKDGEEDVALIYTYENETFVTTGSSTVSIILTPTYKLFIVVGEEKTELISNDKYTNEIYDILGGTSWTKTVLEKTATGVSAELIISVTFNENGTGSVTKDYQNYNKGNAIGTHQIISYNIKYKAEKTDGSYKLIFEFVSADESNVGSPWEFGVAGETGSTNTSNDFSIINKESTVTVNGEIVSLSLWLKTGGKAENVSTEQAVSFDKVTEE